MNNWRPEEWDAQKILEDMGEVTSFTKFEDMIEAGADALMKAIWKKAEESPTKTFVFSAIPLVVNNKEVSNE